LPDQSLRKWNRGGKRREERDKRDQRSIFLSLSSLSLFPLDSVFERRAEHIHVYSQHTPRVENLLEIRRAIDVRKHRLGAL
jgi:hypothetical protein